MATDRGLTRLIERLEETGARAELSARSLLGSLDPLLLADTASPTLDVVGDQLSLILARAATEARGHVGAWSSDLGGRVTRVELVADELNVLEFELDNAIERLRLAVDQFVVSAISRGMSRDAMIGSIQRSLDAVAGRAGAVPGGSAIHRAMLEIGDLMSRAVSGVARVAQIDAFDIQVDEPVIWVAALVKTCPDCLPRHGEVRTLSQWQGLGFPASGWSVCGPDCQCQVLPREVGFGIPIVRRAGRRATRQRLSA